MQNILEKYFCNGLRYLCGMSANPILLEAQYLPPVWYFSELATHPAVYIEQHEHYVKGSYRNRCHIAAVNGIQRLSIPLRKGKNQQQPIREVRIAYDEPWRAQHWQAIRSAYGNSPFFEHYAGAFEPFFTQKKYEWLWDWNVDLIRLLVQLTGLKTEIRFTESYQPAPAGMLDFREKIHPKRPAQDPGFQPGYYPQVFEDRHGFLENLSVIDLIFCAGPAAGNVLMRSVVH